MFIYSETMFWVVSAYFIYCAGTFFLFLYVGFLPKNEQESSYTLNSLLTITRTILLSIALITNDPKSPYIDKKTKKQKEAFK